MTRKLGNSGAPRWYDNDYSQFARYLEHLRYCGATATEIVLHDGPADLYTSRVHVLRDDWERVIAGYQDHGLSVYFHGSLTPEFAVARWSEERERLLKRYDSLLRMIASVAEDQGDTTLVLHGSGDPQRDLRENERTTVEFLTAISDKAMKHSSRIRIAIELRAFNDVKPTSAANSRESVSSIVENVNAPIVGICWDVAHDVENALKQGENWQLPDADFLSRITHIHVHDIADDGEPHSPLTIGRVPIHAALESRPSQPVIMEIRWRMAMRLGRPWDVLAESYRVVTPTQSFP
jgi:sugar phosphate isomerase/epimerase